MIETIAEGTRKTRKVHQCFDCYRPIPKGTEARFFTGKHDYVYTLYMHLDCTEASIAYRNEADCHFYDYDDGMPPLADEINEFGEGQLDIDWLRGRFPHVACRLEFWRQKTAQKRGEWECPQ